jgi:hypothetical protein
VAVGGPQAKGLNAAACPDGSGGWYIAWEDYQVDASHPDIRLQHLAPSGDPVTGWSLAGVLVSGGPKDEFFAHLTQDGQGGVLVSWQDGRSGSWDVYVQRYSSGGAVAPGWPQGGSRATGNPAQQQEPQIACDGAGGAFVVWSDDRNIGVDGYERGYCQHLLGDGSIASGWPIDGLQICSTRSIGEKVISDGQGGCFVAWGDGRNGGTLPDKIDVYVQHLLPDGSIAPGWQLNGNLAAPKLAFRDLLPDGSGGLYVSSAELTPSSIPAALRFWLSHLTATGVPVAGWTLAGIPLQSAIGDRNELSCAADSAGGVLACWDDGNSAGGDIYALRILPNGSVAPGWTPNGMPISDLTNPDESTASVGPDGMGGAYFAWEKVIGGLFTRSYVQHISAHGTIYGGWPAGGLPVATSTSPQTVPRVAHDGSSGALVYWNQRSVVVAQYFVTDGIVATTLSLASTDVRSDRVTLIWQGVGASGLVANVYRRAENEEWKRVGSAAVDAPDRLRYEDASVSAGTRYAYRLGYSEAGTEQLTSETWVEVPTAAVFALEGLRPNPAVDGIKVSFSLAREGQATLDLLDLAGRLVIDREVGGLGAGRHLLRLDSGERISPGVYWLRLRQGEQQALKRAVVIR